MSSIPETQAAEPFLDLKRAVAFFHRRLGKKIHHCSVHRWVAEEGLPAYRNPLRKNPQGEPTLAFKESELEAWLQTKLMPV